jgi:hypothetical protein
LAAIDGGQALSASAISFWRSINGGRWVVEDPWPVLDWPAAGRVTALATANHAIARRDTRNFVANVLMVIEILLWTFDQCAVRM